jgi:hypothetical protein
LENSDSKDSFGFRPRAFGELDKMRDKMTWTKDYATAGVIPEGTGYRRALDYNNALYICTEGPLKDSCIRIIRQDQFEKNRYCSIALSCTDQVIYDKLQPCILEACNEVKHPPRISDYKDEYTFYVTKGGNRSKEFFQCIEVINKEAPLENHMNEIAESVGKVYAG